MKRNQIETPEMKLYQTRKRTSRMRTVRFPSSGGYTPPPWSRPRQIQTPPEAETPSEAEALETEPPSGCWSCDM